jgi:coatomer protein complex subunit alpha (xenin)
MSRFHNALYLGDILERIRILAEVGLLPLAYMMAVTHNIEDMARVLKPSLGDNLGNIDFSFFKPTALVPPKPLIPWSEKNPQVKQNWPHHSIAEEELLTLLAQDEVKKPEEMPGDINLDLPAAEDNTIAPMLKGQPTEEVEPQQSEWVIDDDIVIPDQPAQPNNAAAPRETLDMTARGSNVAEQYVKTSSQLAGEHVACGFIESACHLLKKQIGAINFAPLAKIFASIRSSSSAALSLAPFMQPRSHQLLADKKRPFVGNSIQSLEAQVKIAYNLTTEGKFGPAAAEFQNILLCIPLLVVANPVEEREAHALVRICLDYLVALRCELIKKTNNITDPQRVLELSLYMCLPNMQPRHRILALRAAMSQAYKTKNFIYAAYCAKKIVHLEDLNPNSAKPDVIANAKKVFTSCEQQGTNEFKLVFEEAWFDDSDFVFKICPKTLRIHKTRESKKCGLTQAIYSQECEGQLCDVCGVCAIGTDVLGIKIM